MLRVTFIMGKEVHATRSMSEAPQVGDEVEMESALPNFPTICRVVSRRWKVPYDMTSIDVTVEPVKPVKKGTKK